MSQLRFCAGLLLSIVYSSDARTHRHHSPQYIDDVLVVVEFLQGQVMVVGDPDLTERLLELTHLMCGGHVQHGRLALLLQPLAVGEQDVTLLHDVSVLVGGALVQY